MSLTCLPKSLVDGLAKKYNIELPFFDQVTEATALDKYIEQNDDLKNLKFEVKQEFIKEVGSLLKKVNEESFKNEKTLKKDKYYVNLKTGQDPKDIIKGYTPHDLDNFAEMFNSSFISLYNSTNLFTLLDIEKNIATTKGKAFKNKNLYDVINRFLYQKDETNNLSNIGFLDDIKILFKSSKHPYGDYKRDKETKLFYVEKVFPFVMSFLDKYYNEYFNPEIFTAQLQALKDSNLDESVSKLIHINPQFGELSKNKDILVGTLLAFEELFLKLNAKPLSANEKLEIINSSEFNKVANHLMGAFRYNDESFGGLKQVDEEFEDESNLEASNDEKITTEGFTSSGNERSGFESASKDTKAILSSLFDLEEEVKVDIFGLPVLLNGFTTFKKLSKMLRGKIDYSDFYDTLVKNKEKFPFIEQLLKNYLLINPSEDINKFFNDYKDPQVRQYLQKIKQGFLQDLSKDRIEAKEIDLTVSKAYDDDLEDFYEVTSTQVNDAKQKKTVTILQDNTTRFYKQFYKDKELVFKDDLLDNNGYIRLEAILRAAEKFEEFSKESNPNKYKAKDVLDVLAVFGIVPTMALKQKDFNSLKRLLSKNASIKTYNNIENFFKKLPLQDTDFKDITDITKNVNAAELTKKIQIELAAVLDKFEGKRANKENIQELRKLLIGKQPIKEISLPTRGAKKESYEILSPADGKIYTKEGYKILISEFPNANFYIYKDTKGKWAVEELTTGLAVGVSNTENTINSVLEAFKDTINKVAKNKENLEKLKSVGLFNEAETESEGQMDAGYMLRNAWNNQKMDTQVKGFTNYDIVDTNRSINDLIKNSLESIANLFREKEGNIALRNTTIKQILKDLKDNISNEIEKLNKVSFKEALMRKNSDLEVSKKEKLFTTLSNPAMQLKDTLPSLYNKYISLEEEFVLEDDGIYDYKGKPRYLIQSLNNLVIKANDLNNHNKKLLIRFPELDPQRNPLIMSSYLFNQMYNVDANGNISPNTQSRLKVNINLITGINLKSPYVNSGGLSINNLHLDDNILASMIELLYNGYQENNNADKESAYNTQIVGIDHKRILPTEEPSQPLNNFLAVPTEFITKLFYAEVMEEVNPDTKTVTYKKYLRYDKSTKNNKIEPIANIFKNYLNHYLLMYYKIEKGDLQYVKDEYQNLGSNYKDLSLFEKDSNNSPDNYIINAELKEHFKNAVLDLDLEDMSLKEMVEEIDNVVTNSSFNNGIEGSAYNQFKKDIFNHLINQVEAYLTTFKYANNSEELKGVIDMFTKGILPYNKFASVPELSTSLQSTGDFRMITQDNRSILRGLLMTYIVNYEILAQEKMLLFTGESMFLKKSSYLKRASTNGATGKYVLYDDWDKAYYNHPDSTESFSFAKNLNRKLIESKDPGLDMSLHKLDDTFRFGQVEDNELKSEIYTQLFKEYKESIALRFGNRFTKKEIDSKAKNALKSYLKMNEADGYGIITMDWYKIFSQLTDTWGPEQEAVYQMIARGEEVPDSLALVTFPIRKFQLVGAAFKDLKNIPADILHKYALGPVHSASSPNLKIKAENLMKEGKAYEIFDSASKKEKLKNKDKKDYFYDGDQKNRVVKPLKAKKVGGKYVYDSGKQVLYGITNLLKDQVHVDTAVKDKVILARQLKRVGKTDLFEDGVPFDFVSTSEESRKSEWNSLSEADKKQESKVYKKYRNIIEDIKSINDLEKAIILDKFGLEEYTTPKGNTKLRLLPGVGKQRLINTLKQELVKRVSKEKENSSNAYIKLMAIEANNIDAELEAFVNHKSLKSIVKSIIEKQTKFRKYHGSNLIQAPVTGMESATFVKENIGIEQTGYLKTYRFGKSVNASKISKLEEERDAKLNAAKSKVKKQSIEQEYQEKIDKLSATTLSEVMIAFTPEWEHLLSLYYEGEEIGSLDNLNKIIREDKQWVEDNQDKLTMLAVRIPIQDPNSIEAFIVKEFLPMTEGAKIVVPSEIVAKSGGDFDIDKLILYFYNVNEDGDVVFDNSFEGLENKVIKGYLDLLRLPEMFYKLITANSVTIVKNDDGDTESEEQIADELARKTGSSSDKYDSTDLRMPLFNVIQKTILQIAKKLLGHFATTRSNFEEIKHAGLLLSSSYTVMIKRSLSIKEKALVKNPKLLKILTKSQEKNVKITFPFRINNEIAYNTDLSGKINLSKVINKEGKSITEIISAVMNGLVDVTSKPWITVFRMNEELTSLNAMFLMSGLPASMTFKFNNQKVIEDFLDNKLALKNSLFKRLLNKNRIQSTSRLLNDTFTSIVNDFVVEEKGKKVLPESALKTLKDMFGVLNITNNYIMDYLDTYIETAENKSIRELNNLVFENSLESLLLKIHNDLPLSSYLTDKDLSDTLGKSYRNMTSKELANQLILLSFATFVKPVSEGITQVLDAIDYDKSHTENIHDEYINEQTLASIEGKEFFDPASFSRLQKLHVSAPYNQSNLIKIAASLIAPMTENSVINEYAIALSSVLRNNDFINKEKKDSVINAFKADFINFIIQNYGTTNFIDKTGKLINENIVEYAIKNGIFVDKKFRGESGREYVSDKLEDKSVATKLFKLVNTFDSFKGLDVFKDYLIPLKGKKIGNEENELDFIYKIGRVFRNLSPTELDDYNNQMQIFKNTTISLNDVLKVIQNEDPEVMAQYIEEDVESFDSIYKELNEYIKEKELTSFSSIDNRMLKDLSNKTVDAINKFKNKANEIKMDVANILPYLTLLQSTSMYSPTSFSNLFINENYDIVNRAIRNFRETSDDFIENLRDFTILFLLNNKNLLRSDKERQLLKMIAGDSENAYSNNKVINTSNYFNNYYSKEFSITNTNTDFDRATSVKKVFEDSALKKSFLFKFIQEDSLKIGRGVSDDPMPQELNEYSKLLKDIVKTYKPYSSISSKTLDGYEDDFSDMLPELKKDFNNITLKDGTNYNVNIETESVVNSVNESVEGTLKNEVLVNYYSNSNELKSGFLGKKGYFILGNKENAKVVNLDFTDADLSDAERKTLIKKSLNHKLKC